MKRLDDKINGNPNDLATASSAKEPRLEEESSEGGARAESGDEEGGGHVFEQSYN